MLEPLSIESESSDQLLDQDFRELLASGITQQITRSIRDQTECIVGLYRLDFENDQLRYPLNIPIHPPLPDVPMVEAETMNVSSRVRVTNCQRFGVRIEVVLHENVNNNEPVFVEVSISSPIEPQ